MKIKAKLEASEEVVKKTAMANARVLKEDWDAARKILKAKKVTWSSVVRNVIQQILKSK